MINTNYRPYDPPAGADVGMNLSRSTATPSPCDCRDVQLDTLRQLVVDGMDQWQASRRLWGPEAPLIDHAAVRAWVRAEFRARFPWLNLPELEDAA